MKLPSFFILFLITSLLLFSGCEEEVSGPDISKWETHDTPLFSIQHPPEWQISMSRRRATEFEIWMDYETDPLRYKENIFLKLQRLGDPTMTLDKFIEITESQIQYQLNGKLHESIRVAENEVNPAYHRLEYSANYNDFNVRWRQYVWLLDDRIYILNMEAGETDFAKYAEVGNLVLNSFRVK